jgi:hypothetical protein
VNNTRLVAAMLVCPVVPTTTGTAQDGGGFGIGAPCGC